MTVRQPPTSISDMIQNLIKRRAVTQGPLETQAMIIHNQNGHTSIEQSSCGNARQSPFVINELI